MITQNVCPFFPVEPCTYVGEQLHLPASSCHGAKFILSPFLAGNRFNFPSLWLLCLVCVPLGPFWCQAWNGCGTLAMAGPALSWPGQCVPNGRGTGLAIRHTWAQNPALPLVSSVTLGSHFMSLSPSFLIYRIWRIMHPLWCCENLRRWRM